MYLSRIYSNKPDLFGPIDFNEGLNVILAEIRLPENRTKDTHNLGKTTLSKLIDYCLLSGNHTKSEFFLKKHIAIFQNFVFYLEIKYGPQQYLTIRRSVESPTKISFKKHVFPGENFVECNEWDHLDLPFDKAKNVLDSILDFRVISPWTYRSALGYCLRVQDDYSDVFKLQKNSRSKDKDWKPYLAKILGFDEKLVYKNYELATELESKKEEAQRLKGELIGIDDDLDKIEGILLIQEDESTKLQKQLDDYNFDISDAAVNKELVEDLDVQIASLNERRYLLTQSIKRIQNALREKIVFDIEATQKLFNEASLYFAGQLKKDFDDLMRFNTTLSEEREQYLKEELTDNEKEFRQVVEDIKSLNAQRSSLLSVLKDKETFSKYKNLSSKLVDIRTQIEELKRRKTFIEQLHKLQKNIAKIELDRKDVQSEIEENINSENPRYANIRRYFNEIIKATIDKNAVISTKPNSLGNLEFSADIINKQGLQTSESDGHTYRKLLCMAFDLAIAREYSNEKFPHFVYHDGGLESLDDRKKLNLIDIARVYSNHGIQYIMTAIDSEIPTQPDGETFTFSETETIFTLHDEGDQGRLFRIHSW